MAQLPLLPEDPRGRQLPPQGTWVKTEGGGEGRYVGRTKSGLYWVWYPRMAQGARGVTYERMVERFEVKRSDEKVRIKISASASETIADVLGCWEAEDANQVTLRTTYVEGPRHLIESLGMRIESAAWDDGELAAGGPLTDHQGKIRFAQIATTVAKLCLGRKLQGGKPIRRLVWQEVEREVW